VKTNNFKYFKRNEKSPFILVALQFKYLVDLRKNSKNVYHLNGLVFDYF